MNTAFFDRPAKTAVWSPEVAIPTDNTYARRPFSRCETEDDLAYLDLRMDWIASTKPTRALWATATPARREADDVRRVLRRMDLELAY